MVWLSGLVGTFATRISPPLSDDQYSPQLPENCHEVERRLKVLGHRKMWRTWQNRTETPIFSNSGDLSLLKFERIKSPLMTFSHGKDHN